LGEGEGLCRGCPKAVTVADFVEVDGELYCLVCANRRKGMKAARRSKILAFPPNVTGVTSARISVTPVEDANKKERVVDLSREGDNPQQTLSARERGLGREATLMPVVATWEPEELEARMHEVIRWWTTRAKLGIRAVDARAVANFDMPLPVLKTALERIYRQVTAKGLIPRSPRMFRQDLQEAQSQHHKGRRPTKGSGMRSLGELVEGRS